MNADQNVRYDHVAITVKDIQKSIAFYRDLLGCEVKGQLLLQDGNFRIVYLRSGNAVIELFDFKEKGKELPTENPDVDFGFKHICFAVEDVDSFTDSLKSNGVEFLVEPKTASTTPLRLAFFKDPDGNKIEITSGKLELLPYDLD